MMKFNIFSSNQLFSDKRFLEMQNKRIEQIKIMNNLYSEKPIKIAERIELIDDLYRKKTREENNTLSKNNWKTLTGGENNNNNDEKNTDLKSKTSENVSKDFNSNLKKNLSPNPNEDRFLKNSSLKGFNIKSLNSLQEPNNKLNVKNNNNSVEQISSNLNYDGIVNKNVKLSNKNLKKSNK